MKIIFNDVILVCMQKTKYLPMQPQHEICRKYIRVGSCDSLQSKKLRRNSIFGDSSLSTLWPPLFPKYTCTNLRLLKKLSFAFLVFHLGFLWYRCIVSTHPQSQGFVLRLGLPMTKTIGQLSLFSADTTIYRNFILNLRDKTSKQLEGDPNCNN